VPIACTYAKVVEPGAFGSFVGRLEMRFENGKLVKDTYTLDEVNAETYPADAKLANIIAANEAPFKAEIDTIVGYSTLPLYRYFVIENPMDTMILNALNWKLKDIDVVLSNGFRFCPPRTTPDHTGNVPITAGYLFDMLPVDSNVRVAQANGAQIKKWLEKELNNVFAKEAAERFGGWVIKFQGMTIEFEAFAPKGQRVKKALIHGEPIELSRMYTLSACERDGDPDDILCRIKGVKNGLTKDFTLHEVIKEYLAVNSPVTPTPPMAAKVLDAPQTLLTQVSGVDYQFV
jgi:S-sulfosulfanyl-L-cysteine sulfohydrolase